MRLATRIQSKEIDTLSQKVYGLSAEILMEAAGTSAARELEQSFFPELKTGELAIVCGPGNNGGDGLVLARHMHSAGFRQLIVYMTEKPTSELTQVNLKRAELHGLNIIYLHKNFEKLDKLKSATVIVDAIFGIGLNKPIEADYLKIIETINSCKVPKMSLDVPSGLDCDKGIVLNNCIKASMTISFGLAKPGFFVAQGPQYTGRLRVVPVGFPYECLRGVATTHFLFTEKLARRYLPKRKSTANKSDFGHAVVLAGSKSFMGAGIMTTQSAFRMGAGFVSWICKSPMTLDFLSSPEAFYQEYSSHFLNKLPKPPTAVVIGPGFGVDEKTKEAIESLKSLKIPVVLDADAITTCVKYNLFPLPKHWILTPHAGELSRVLELSPQEIESNRYELALKASQKAGCTILLKGFRSVLAYDDRIMVIPTGNVALAKAGSGDVLSGFLVGLLAQGGEVLQKAATAAYIHGRMADEWVSMGRDYGSLNAHDLSDHLPNLLGRLQSGALF